MKATGAAYGESVLTLFRLLDVQLDELEDWLTAHNPRVMRELRQARRDDLGGKFKPWKPRFLPCRTGSK